MPRIPTPGMDPDEAYRAYTMALLGMVNPMMMAQSPITPKPGEIEKLLGLAKTLKKPEPTAEQLIYQMARDRILSAQVGSSFGGGRAAGINDLLRSLVQPKYPDLRQLLPGLLGSSGR